MKKKNEIDSILSDEEIWFSSQVADPTHTFDEKEAFKHFNNRVIKLEKRTRFKRLFYKIEMAAIFILLLGFAVFLSYKQGEQNIQKCFTDIIVEAPLGSKSKICLPDSTILWLNAGSKVVYSQGFGVENRNLKLEGEGYFEVKKNKKVPFVVSTSELDVTVLGTKFNFRNYLDDREVIVELLEGKVSLMSQMEPDQVKYLAPMERMVMNKETGSMDILKSEGVAKASAWTQDILFFNEELLPDIVQDLMRSYGVQIEIKNQNLVESRFYGLFNIQKQNVFDVLDLFAKTGRLKYIVEDEVIYLL